MIRITCCGNTLSFEKGTLLQAALAALLPPESDKALGALCDGQVLDLNTPLQADCSLIPLTFQHEEGRRIYERSLRFVLLMAVSRCCPYARLRIEHSIGYGLYFQLQGKRALQGDASLLENTMREIVAEDLPFRISQWKRRDAVAYFTSVGWQEKAQLLREGDDEDLLSICSCGDMKEYFYGAMLPSTGWVPVFSVRFHPPGLILQMPSPADPSRPAPYVSRPKHMAAFYESNDWCRMLHCMNASDLNRMTENGEMRDFIRVNESLHTKQLANIADDVLRMGAKAVFVAGPSSSGKTTTANRLKIQLTVLGMRPVLISMDNFYRNRAHVPLGEDGKPDLESLHALNVDLFLRCVHSLLEGKPTGMPSYDFHTGARKDNAYTLQLKKDQPLIVEGIHGLNPALREGFDAGDICKLYLSELTCLNLDNHNRIRTTDARLLRRIVRDHLFRGTPPQDTLAMWASVRSGEEKWIFPYQESADVVFNSALHYELPVLKALAYDLLTSVPSDDPNHYIIKRLTQMLDYFIPVPLDILNEIPPLSILREFIGGNTLYQ